MAFQTLWRQKCYPAVSEKDAVGLDIVEYGLGGQTGRKSVAVNIKIPRVSTPPSRNTPRAIRWHLVLVDSQESTLWPAT